MTFQYERGVYVEDLVTGFKGVITARQDHLTNCNCYFVKPSVDKDGKDIVGRWVDEHALVIDITKTKLVLHQEANEPPG